MAVPAPSISCCVLNHNNLFYQIQNVLAFNCDTCCPLALCLRLLPFHYLVYLGTDKIKNLNVQINKKIPDLKLKDSMEPVFPVNHCKQLSGAEIDLENFNYYQNLNLKIRDRIHNTSIST
jgi:hypothetical protein